MGKHLTTFEKGEIYAYRQCSPPVSWSKISQKMKRSKNTIRKYKNIVNRGFGRKQGSGRPKIINKETTKKEHDLRDCKIIAHVKKM